MKQGKDKGDMYTYTHIYVLTYICIYNYITIGVMKAGKDKGAKKEVRGYWSDVVASPYFSIGIYVCMYL
jgi:hypothetical protein